MLKILFWSYLAGEVYENKQFSTINVKEFFIEMKENLDYLWQLFKYFILCI